MNLAKKIIPILILVVFLNQSAKAQDTLFTKFVNSVYNEVVDTNSTYYYLLNIGKNPQFDTYDLIDLKAIIDNSKNETRDIPFQDFIDLIKADTTKVNWCKLNLEKAKCVDKDHGPKYSYMLRVLNYIPYNSKDSIILDLENKGIIPVLLKPGMSKKQMKAQEKLALAKYQSKPIDEKQFYSFSKPIFSKNNKYVLIELNKSESGCLFIFKFSAGKWKRLLEFRCWKA